MSGIICEYSFLLRVILPASVGGNRLLSILFVLGPRKITYVIYREDKNFRLLFVLPKKV